MYYCYILKSLKSLKYYIGSTEDLKIRVRQHNRGMNFTTKIWKPWRLVYYEEFYTLREAKKRELQIKKWKSRAAIERLIKKKREMK